MKHDGRAVLGFIAQSALARGAIFIGIATGVGPLPLPSKASVLAPPSLSLRSREVVRLVEQRAVGRVHDLAFSPRRGSQVCVFALQQTLQVWDMSGRPRLISTLEPPLPEGVSRIHAAITPHPISFSSDGSRLAMGYFGIQVWDLDQRKVLFAMPLWWDPQALRLSAADDRLIVACSFRGFFNFAGGGDLPGKIEIFTRRDYERMPVNDPTRFDVHKALSRCNGEGTDPRENRNFYCLVVYPDGKAFAAGGVPVVVDQGPDQDAEPTVGVWNTATRRRKFTIGDKDLPIRRFCLSPSGDALYSCGDAVLGWDATKSAPPIKKFDASDHRMVSVAVSPDSAMVAAGAADGAVLIWDADSTERLATLAHCDGPVYCLSFSPTSTKLVAAGERGVATVWDVLLTKTKQK